MFQTIVYRTDLITDPDVLAAVDAQLAAKVPRWPSMTQGRLAAQIDKIVATADADAVRRRRERHAEREVWFADLRQRPHPHRRQPAQPRRARAGQAVDGAGGHGV